MATLSIDLLADAGGTNAPPAAFRIFRAGINESTKGIFKFTQASAEAVMKRYRDHGAELSIDYNHGMFAFVVADPSESAKAAGWFKPEIRDGELWASAPVRWTPKATKHLTDGEFRYISPAFHHDDAGNILSLLNVALTNTPALYELEPLVASRLAATTVGFIADDDGADMNWKQLLAMLGLQETATEADAVAAVARGREFSTELLSLTGKTTGTEALGVVKAWKAAADQMPALHQELTALKQQTVDDKRKALIADATKRGVVPPAYEPVLATMDLPQLEAFLKVAQPVHVKPANEATDGSALVTSLSTTDQQVAAMLGVKPEDLAKRKLLRNGQMPIGTQTVDGKTAAATK